VGVGVGADIDNPGLDSEAAELSTGTMDIPTTLIWATAALTRERPKTNDFMITLRNEGGAASDAKREKKRSC